MRHPSIAVKIDNHEDARPQIALNRTDLVFEELVEGGLTRYVAVWHSDVPDEVGPVRSIRPMDPGIAGPLDGIIAYSGGQQYFVDLMKATGLVNIVFDEDDSLFERADERPGPHDVILAAAEAVRAALGARAAGRAVRLRLRRPARGALPRSHHHPALRARVLGGRDTRRGTGTPPPSRGCARRRAQPDLEASGERIRATNVVTLRVGIDWRLRGGAAHAHGRVGRGVGLGGREDRARHLVEGRRRVRRSCSRPTTAARLRLAPGNTWIELVPNEGSAAFAP